MKDCPKWVSWVALVAGILFAIQDLQLASLAFWKFEWSTVAFLLVGLAGTFGSK